MKFFKKFNKKEESAVNSKDAAKERLHLVLMQDRLLRTYEARDNRRN